MRDGLVVRLVDDPDGRVQMPRGAVRSIFPDGVLTVGRSPDCRITVAAEDVHRRNLRFFMDQAGRFVLENLGTSDLWIDDQLNPARRTVVETTLRFALGRSMRYRFEATRAPREPLARVRELTAGIWAYGVGVDDDDIGAGTGVCAYARAGDELVHLWVVRHEDGDALARGLAFGGSDADDLPRLYRSWREDTWVWRAYVVGAGVSLQAIDHQEGTLPEGPLARLTSAYRKLRRRCSARGVRISRADVWVGFDGRVSLRVPPRLEPVRHRGPDVDGDVALDGASRDDIAGLVAGLFGDERRAWDELVEQLAIAGA